MRGIIRVWINVKHKIKIRMKSSIIEEEIKLYQNYTQVIDSQKVITSLYGELYHQMVEKRGADHPSFDTLVSLGEILQINSNQIQQTSQKILQFQKSIEGMREEIISKVEDEKIKIDKKGFKARSKKRRKRPYGFYSEATKLSAIQAVESGKDVHVVAEEIGVNFKNILRWKKEGYQRKIPKQPANQPQLEKQLSEWLVDLVQKEQTVLMPQIKQKALSLSNDQNFKASRDWMLRFLRTSNLLDKVSLTSNKQ